MINSAFPLRFDPIDASNFPSIELSLQPVIRSSAGGSRRVDAQTLGGSARRLAVGTHPTQGFRNPACLNCGTYSAQPQGARVKGSNMFQRLTASLTPTSFLPSALLGITGTKESKYATSDATDDEFASDTMSQFEMPKVGGAGRLTPATISNVPPRSPRNIRYGVFFRLCPPRGRVHLCHLN